MSKLIHAIIYFIPNLITKDFGRKVIALALTALVYFSVSDRIKQTRVIEGVEIKCTLPNYLVDVGGKSATANVTVTGSESAVSELSRHDFQINVPFETSQYQPGKTTYDLTVLPTHVKGPFRVRVTNVDRSKVPFEIDRIAGIKLPVKASYSANSRLPEGYQVTKVTFAQPEVQVSGPESMLANLTDIATEPIPLEKTTQSFSYTAALKNPNPAISLVPATVMVNVEIAPSLETRSFTDIPVRILKGTQKDKEDFSVEILSGNKVTITVEGNQSAIELLVKENICPYIDVSQLLNPGIYNVDVNCWLDRSDVTIKSIHPKLLSVKLTKEIPGVRTGKSGRTLAAPSGMPNRLDPSFRQ